MNCSSCLNNCNTTGKVKVNSCVCWTFVPLEPVWCSWEWLVPDLSSLCVGEQQVEDGREKTGASWFSLLRNTLFPQFHTWPRWARRGRRERARPAPSLVGYLLVLRTGCEGGEREHSSVSLTHSHSEAGVWDNRSHSRWQFRHIFSHDINIHTRQQPCCGQRLKSCGGSPRRTWVKLCLAYLTRGHGVIGILET